ncbi:antibiotic biosynthesis monooxygenase [Actinophytocola sp.]|uniref:antibiotic biosynthesis monooxygenase n=1 Tax=Actinophytocola sp. TaxID=1872138 RepID=UPI002ED4F7E8
MTMVAITRFTADPAAAEEVRARHAALVSAIRSAASGLAEARLGRLDDRTWVGIWQWDSAEHLRTARQAVADRPETAAAFALVADVTGEEVELVDER